MTIVLNFLKKDSIFFRKVHAIIYSFFLLNLLTATVLEKKNGFFIDYRLFSENYSKKLRQLKLCDKIFDYLQ